MNSIVEFRRGKDRKKRKRRFTNSKAFEVGKNIVTGSVLAGIGVYGLKKGLGDDFVKDLNPLKMSSQMKRDIRSSAQNTATGILGAGAVLAPTILVAKGTDKILNRKDKPITQRIRRIARGDFNAISNRSNLNFVEFKKPKEHTRTLKSGKKVLINRGVKEDKEGIKNLLMDWKKKPSFKGHMVKGIGYGAAIEGSLSGLAASPIPPLIIPATAVGAISGGIKGGIVGSSAYGIRKGLQERKKK